MATAAPEIDRVVDEGDIWTVVATGDRLQVRCPDWSRVKVSRKQWEIYNCPATNIIVNAGTGFGKDHVGVMWAFKKAKALMKYCRIHGFRHNGPIVVAICAPKESNYLPTWEKLQQMLPRIPGRAKDGSPNYILRDGKHKSITLFGKSRGIRFEMITLFNEDSVRGAGWDICLITEAAFMKKTSFRKVVLKRVNRGGYYGAIMLISTPRNNWWDDACDDAELKQGGEFTTYDYFEATSYDNPLMDEGTRAKIEAQEKGNPLEFEQERLAKRHVKVVEGSADCPFHPGMVECALSKDKPTVTGQVLLVYDLIYGGDDKLCETAWDVSTRRMLDIEIWGSKELGMTPENAMTTLSALIAKRAARFPGCRIAYDRQGQFGGALQAHLPRHLNVLPMTRNREQKNSHVEDFLLRAGTLDAAGKSVGIRLLHPDNAYLTPRQRECARTLLNQVYAYRKIYVLDNLGNPKVDKAGRLEYYYTKGAGVGDDAFDSVTWACSQLPPINRGGSLNQSAMRARVLG